ncbi:MAG: hypothetical protein JNM13_07920 [Hyphomicrobiaceae bacterium]|nr:hypothetical protein [Hyphomicrobiaceae bacterium]
MPMFRPARLLAVIAIAAVAAGLTLSGQAANKVQTETITVPSAPAGPKPPPGAGDPHDKPAMPGPATAPKAGLTLEVHYGTEGLPERVKAMRARILEAVKSGDIEALRTPITSNEMPPIFAENDVPDPIAYLKSQSGDAEGREILAILWDLLDAGWVKANAGTAQEMYVWPYFAEHPIDQLSNEQLVEMFRIVTASDYDEMRAAGKYIFYKIGIGPDGTWHYFKLAD